jgi:hypothetical protein
MKCPLLTKDQPLGIAVFLWRNLVKWRSKKQSVVEKPNAKAEIFAMAPATRCVELL